MVLPEQPEQGLLPEQEPPAVPCQFVLEQQIDLAVWLAALLLPVWVCEGFVLMAEPLFKVRVPASFHVLIVPTTVVFVLSIEKVWPLVTVTSAAAFSTRQGMSARQRIAEQ